MKKLFLLLCVPLLLVFVTACDMPATPPTFGGYGEEGLCINSGGDSERERVLYKVNVDVNETGSFQNWTCGCPPTENQVDTYEITRSYFNNEHQIIVNQHPCLGMDLRTCNDNPNGDVVATYGNLIEQTAHYYRVLDIPAELDKNDFPHPASCDSASVFGPDNLQYDIEYAPYCDAFVAKYIQRGNAAIAQTYNENTLKKAIQECVNEGQVLAGIGFSWDGYLVTNASNAFPVEAIPPPNTPEGVAALAYAFGAQRIQEPWPQIQGCIAGVFRQNYTFTRSFIDNGNGDSENPHDHDGDSICDVVDSCVDTPNFAQNLNGDMDDDSDGDNTACDNCPDDYNPLQEDNDHDGIGNACDLCPEESGGTEDADDDGVGDECDSCPGQDDPDIQAQDGDGDCIINAEDNCPDVDTDEAGNSDEDNDGKGQACDNCPDSPNEDQADTDGNNKGDACEDWDEDGVPDEADNCAPPTPDPDKAYWGNPSQLDSDGDGEGDNCDGCRDLPSTTPDDDGDCIANEEDNCPELGTSAQGNDDSKDSDGFGDECDICPFIPNPDQLNVDMDGDTIPDQCDNCPFNPNPDQTDSNSNGKGNICEISGHGFGFSSFENIFLNIRLFNRGLSLLHLTHSITNMDLNTVTGATCTITNLSSNSLVSVFEPTTWACNIEGIPSVCTNILWNEPVESTGHFILNFTLTTNDGRAPIEDRIAFTIYDIQMQELTPGYNITNTGDNQIVERTLNIYSNNDDDNLPGETGFDLPDWIHSPDNNNTHEDDLVGVRFRVEPPISNSAIHLKAADGIKLDARPQDNKFTIWRDALKTGHVEDVRDLFDKDIQLGMEGGGALIPSNQTDLYFEGGVIGSQSEIDVRLAFLNMDSNGDTVVVENESLVLEGTESLKLNVVSVDLVNGEADNLIALEPSAGHVNIGLWDHAYYLSPDGREALVYNEADPAHNFIDRDSRRFFVRINNPNLNNLFGLDSLAANSAEAPTLTIRATEDGNVTILDNPTPLSLREISRESGLFISPAQLLTTEKFMGGLIPRNSNTVNCEEDYACDDDDFNAHDGLNGLVTDDTPGDRTHAANIHSQVEVAYRGSPFMPTATRKIPVCKRFPDERAALKLRFTILNEPYQDENGNGRFDFNDLNGNGACDDAAECEPFYDLFDDANQALGPNIYHNAVLARTGIRGPLASQASIFDSVALASLLWQQGCIEIQLVGDPATRDAPIKEEQDYFLNHPLDPINGSAVTPNDILDIATRLFDLAYLSDPNIIDVFVLPGVMANLHGIAFIPTSQDVLRPILENKGFIFISNEALFTKALAHEIGHILENRVHLDNDVGRLPDMSYDPLFQTFIYPLGPDAPVEQLTYGRRLDVELIERAHSRRNELDYTGIGNRFLTPISD